MVACRAQGHKLTMKIKNKTKKLEFQILMKLWDIYVYPGTRQILGTKVDPIKPGLLFHTEK